MRGLSSLWTVESVSRYFLTGLCRQAVVRTALLASAGVLAFALMPPAVPATEVRITVPQESEFQTRTPTLDDLHWARAGNAVIYMRHGATDARFPDQIPVDLSDCAAQRPLSEAGREQLHEIAKAFARLDLPLALPLTSPFCRAMESTAIVFGPDYTVDDALRYTAAMPEREKAPAVERTRWHLSRPLDTPGTNRVVVAHGPNIAELIDYLPPEGTVILFQPLGDDFAYVAGIEPKDWAQVLRELALE